MSNDTCWGVEFDRHGKHWAWCCYDGFVFEITPAPKTCTRCGRPWTPVPATEPEMKRIQPNVEQFVDFPYYKVRAAELEAENAKLRGDGNEIDRLSKGILEHTRYPEPRIQGSAVDTAIELVKHRLELLRRLSDAEKIVRAKWDAHPGFAVLVLSALTGKQQKCPSTYTHSSRGKLECEKDEAHLHRRGDVEHTRDGVKWMSV